MKCHEYKQDTDGSQSGNMWKKQAQHHRDFCLSSANQKGVLFFFFFLHSVPLLQEPMF